MGQAHTSPNQGEETHDEPDHRTSLQTVDLTSELVAHDRELVKGRVQERIVRAGVMCQHEIEHGHQKEQEWEHAQESRESEVGHEDPSVIVAEFLDDAEDDGGGAEALLGGVDSSHCFLE